MTNPGATCPACGGTDLRRVEHIATGGGLASGTFLALQWGQLRPTGTVEGRICRKCGRMELYLTDPSVLDHL